MTLFEMSLNVIIKTLKEVTYDYKDKNECV